MDILTTWDKSYMLQYRMLQLLKLVIILQSFR